MSLLRVENLSKSYDSAAAVSDVAFSLSQGWILCLLGPSGCGKTTLLRLIAGLARPDSGRVLFEGEDITCKQPHKRNFGLMFQEFALFPHKSVYENVAFGPRMQELAPGLVHRRTENMLALVGMSDLAERNVAELSGGERQRVALARSLAPRPRLLMLDEPLGALDRNLRERLLPEVRTILKRLDVPAIFVTHDQSEAFAVSDRIAVMNRGRIEQIDSPEKLYMRPKSEFAARFLGFQNLLQARVLPDGGAETELGTFHPPGGFEKGDNAAMLLALRPEGAAVLDGEGQAGGSPVVEGVVTRRVFTGQTYRVTVAESRGPTLVFDLPNAKPPPRKGERIVLKIDPSCMALVAASKDNKE